MILLILLILLYFLIYHKKKENKYLPFIHQKINKLVKKLDKYYLTNQNERYNNTIDHINQEMKEILISFPKHQEPEIYQYFNSIMNKYN